MPEFIIERNDLGKGAVEMVVRGFLDAHTFEQLEGAIADAFSEESYKLLVDLSGVAYISSAGAGVFIGALSESQENGGNIVLINPTENVRQVFDLLGLTQIFQIADNRREGLRMFQQRV